MTPQVSKSRLLTPQIKKHTYLHFPTKKSDIRLDKKIYFPEKKKDDIVLEADTNSAPQRMHNNISNSAEKTNIPFGENFHHNTSKNHIKNSALVYNKGLTCKASDILEKFNVFNNDKKLQKKQKKLAKKLSLDQLNSSNIKKQQSFVKNVNNNYYRDIMSELKKAEIANQTKHLIDISYNNDCDHNIPIKEFNRSINQIFSNGCRYKSNPCLGIPDNNSGSQNHPNDQCKDNHIQNDTCDSTKNCDVDGVYQSQLQSRQIDPKFEDSKPIKKIDTNQILNKDNDSKLKKNTRNRLSIDGKYFQRRFEDHTGNNFSKPFQKKFARNNTKKSRQKPLGDMSPATATELNHTNIQELNSSIGKLKTTISNLKHQKFINTGNSFVFSDNGSAEYASPSDQKLPNKKKDYSSKMFIDQCNNKFKSNLVYKVKNKRRLSIDTQKFNDKQQVIETPNPQNRKKIDLQFTAHKRLNSAGISTVLNTANYSQTNHNRYFRFMLDKKMSEIKRGFHKNSVLFGDTINIKYSGKDNDCVSVQMKYLNE